MKKLRFMPHLVPLVIDGSKTITWRLFDDKDLQAGDILEFLNKETNEKFANAQIISIQEKKMGDITREDEIGHEPFRNNTERLETYKKYYGDRVTQDTIVKMISFKLL
jgi:hypothetical protein